MKRIGKKYLNRKIWAMTLGLILSQSVVMAQEGQRQERKQLHRHQSGECPHMGQEHRDRREKLRQVSGQVLEIKNVDVKGTDQKNVVLLLKTTKGNQRLIVDLGSIDETNKLGLQEKATISVVGEVGRLGERMVLIAHRFKVGEQVIEVDRKAQTDQAKKEGHKKMPQVAPEGKKADSSRANQT